MGSNKIPKGVSRTGPNTKKNKNINTRFFKT